MGRRQKELADAASRILNVPIETGRLFLQHVMSMVADDIVKSGRIELRGLGTFTVKARAPRKVTHPKTGKKVRIPEKRTVLYRSSVALRRRLNKKR